MIPMVCQWIYSFGEGMYYSHLCGDQKTRVTSRPGSVLCHASSHFYQNSPSVMVKSQLFTIFRALNDFVHSTFHSQIVISYIIESMIKSPFPWYFHHIFMVFTYFMVKSWCSCYICSSYWKQTTHQKYPRGRPRFYTRMPSHRSAPRSLFCIIWAMATGNAWRDVGLSRWKCHAKVLLFRINRFLPKNKLAANAELESILCLVGFGDILEAWQSFTVAVPGFFRLSDEQTG